MLLLTHSYKSTSGRQREFHEGQKHGALISRYNSRLFCLSESALWQQVFHRVAVISSRARWRRKSPDCRRRHRRKQISAAHVDALARIQSVIAPRLSRTDLANVFAAASRGGRVIARKYKMTSAPHSAPGAARRELMEFALAQERERKR